VSIITLDVARSYVTSSTETANDVELEAALLAAESSVRRFCGRDFDKETTATARTFRPASAGTVWVDDFYTVTGLIVATDDNDDGTAEATWASTDYVLFPLDGKQAGETVPYYRIDAVEARFFPTCNRRPSVSVTARWGWTAVPDAVETATLLECSRIYSRRTSPAGVAAFGDFGPFRVRGGMDPTAMELLIPYRHPRVAFGIGG
jgi:hypothetical protein